MRRDPQLRNPTPPPAPVAVTPQIAPAVGQLEGMNYNQLRARFNELQNQRQLLADRRANVASTYERASGVSKEGIGARLTVMDKSMVQIESDLAAVGQAMVNKAQSTSVPPAFPPRNNRSNFGPGEALSVALVVFLATMLVAVPLAVRRAKRRWLSESPGAGTSALGYGADRLNRIEQAVDAIAIEIERVSENQRFMTRLMTETQLAGTIAAVRGSAELAKAAAEEPPGRT